MPPQSGAVIMTPDEADALQACLAGWAEGEPACRALALVGSWARGDAREGSDLDLIALVDDLAPWIADAGWLVEALEPIGRPVESVGFEVYGVARSWRIRLGSGAELELTLAATSWASNSPLDPGTYRIVTDGVRPLVDKDGLLRAIC
jgi:predicted nucleotidyltransferase